MYGVSTGVLKLCRFYGVDPDELTRPTIGCVMVEQFIDHLEARNVRAMGPTRMPLFTVHAHKIREYQWVSVKNALRKSGFVVAPCGSGKTLIGLMVAVLNGGRFLIVTTRYAEQWRMTLANFFSPIGQVDVVLYSDIDAIDIHNMPHVVIATYAGFNARTKTTKTRLVRQMMFTTMILDEAHNAASPQNLKMVQGVHSRHSILLTATMIREDAELCKLQHEFGGIVCSVNRAELVRDGHIADVKCINIIVPYDDTLEAMVGKTTALAIHPNKMQVLHSALSRLCSAQHKVLIFCDDLFCLRWTSLIMTKLGKVPIVGFISMQTPYVERAAKIAQFETQRTACALFLSRTGDEALDIPSATAAVVFWNHWGSRRQIVQRIGRIARHSTSKAPALFLTLISQDEKELERSSHREMYVAEHGFTIETVHQDKSEFGTRLRARHDKYCATLAKVYGRHRPKRIL